MKFVVLAALVLAVSGCVESAPEAETQADVDPADVDAGAQLEPIPVLPMEVALDASHQGELRLGACATDANSRNCFNSASPTDDSWTWVPEGLGPSGILDVVSSDLVLSWTDSIPDGGASVTMEIWEIDGEGHGIAMHHQETGLSPMTVDLTVNDWTAGNRLWFQVSPYYAYAGSATIEVGRGQDFSLEGEITVLTDVEA